MKQLKRIARNMLLAAGYDIRKTSHIGLDSNRDVQRILGERAPTTIFDVGAHLGETATEYAQIFPSASIYCFEPSPKTFAILKNNVARLQRVEVINAALGDACVSQTLFVNKFSATNSLLRARADVSDPATRSLLENTERVETEVITLDHFCRGRSISSIDLLKLDVQGFEGKVIAGARELLTRGRVSLVYAEVTFEMLYEQQTTFTELHSMLADFGFEFVDFYSHTRTAHHSTRWCDALFVNPAALRNALS